MNTTQDKIDNSAFERNLLPSTLNVLTILTFIGSAIMAIFSIFGYFQAQTAYEKRDEMIAKAYGEEVPAFVKGMMPPKEQYIQMLEKNYEVRLPILLLGLLSSALCIYGAVQMRKLKKQGFPIYTIGELLPFVGSFLFMGTMAFSNSMSFIFPAIAILFIILYYTQRKHLVY